MTRVKRHSSCCSVDVGFDSSAIPSSNDYDTLSQPFNSIQFGVWLFLSTEILLFISFVWLYVVVRTSKPEIFNYGIQYVDITWGTISTCLLVFSSVTMLLAVWSARTGHRRALCVFLGLTLMCGINFLGIKYIEYSNKFHDDLWGITISDEIIDQPELEPDVVSVLTLEVGDVEHGKQIYLRTCLSCHGVTGGGLPGLGKPLTTSRFVSDLTDLELVAFLRIGRAPKAPENTSGLAMPARGGNPRLVDQDLMDVTSHLRALQDAIGTVPTEEVDKAVFIITRSNLPPAAIGPTGLVKNRKTNGRQLPVNPHRDSNRPAQAHLFFGLYFLLTGLHSIHTLIGSLLIVWLLFRTMRGHFSTSYFTPVLLGGRYWHTLNLIWIVLFSLFYFV